MRRAKSLAFVCLPLSLFLTACQSTGFTYGYVNRLKETVTVVEDGLDGRTLTPNYALGGVPGGSLADRVEFLDARGRRIGIFTLDDSRGRVTLVFLPSSSSRLGEHTLPQATYGGGPHRNGMDLCLSIRFRTEAEMAHRSKER